MKNDNEEKNPPFTMVYECMAELYGLDVAATISALLKHQEYMQILKRLDREGFFYMEHKTIQRKIGISDHRQIKAMKVLVKIGVLQKSPIKKGTPPKTFYKVNSKKYKLLLAGLNKVISQR